MTRLLCTSVFVKTYNSTTRNTILLHISLWTLPNTLLQKIGNEFFVWMLWCCTWFFKNLVFRLVCFFYSNRWCNIETIVARSPGTVRILEGGKGRMSIWIKAFPSVWGMLLISQPETSWEGTLSRNSILKVRQSRWIHWYTSIH